MLPGSTRLALAIAFARRASLREEMALRQPHPLLELIRRTSGAPVTIVRCRRERLYVDLENSSPFWTYRELASSRAEFTCEGSLPDTVGVSAERRRFGDFAQVANLSAFLDDERMLAIRGRQDLVAVELLVVQVRLP